MKKPKSKYRGNRKLYTNVCANNERKMSVKGNVLHMKGSSKVTGSSHYVSSNLLLRQLPRRLIKSFRTEDDAINTRMKFLDCLKVTQKTNYKLLVRNSA